MIRALSIVAPACVVLGFILLADNTRNVVPAVLLMLGGIGAIVFLALRRVVLMARRVVTDARAFMSGDVQRARLVRFEDPKGLFFPASAAVLELEGEDGAVHRFERNIPIPFSTAWSYRIAKRLPFLRTIDIERLRELAAFELKREGLRVSLSRPQQAAPELSP